MSLGASLWAGAFLSTGALAKVEAPATLTLTHAINRPRSAISPAINTNVHSVMPDAIMKT